MLARSSHDSISFYPSGTTQKGVTAAPLPDSLTSRLGGYGSPRVGSLAGILMPGQRADE